MLRAVQQRRVTRGTYTRLTFDPGSDMYAVWTPDGERVLFQSDRGGVGLFWKAADGTGSAERLTDDEFFPSIGVLLSTHRGARRFEQRAAARAPVPGITLSLSPGSVPSNATWASC